MLTRDEIRKYLDRLEYDKIPAPDLETLHALQWAHLTHVPYENIDALLGIPISLKPDDLYRKIVLEHRGGWCFELQGAYGYLLQSLGFAVMQYAARFMDEPGVVQMRRHRILVVDFNGRRYLTDVGVRSESPRKPRTLVGNVYKEYRDAKVQVQQVLETKEEIARVLLERFGLDARQN